MFNVRKIEELKNLEISIETNIEAMDRLENWINRVENKLNYSEDDYLREELSTLKYLQFTLNYLDKQYVSTYRKLGGKKVFNYE